MSLPGHSYTQHYCRATGQTCNLSVGGVCPYCQDRVDAPDGRSILSPSYPHTGYPPSHTLAEAYQVGDFHQTRVDGLDVRRETIGFGHPNAHEEQHPYHVTPAQEAASPSYHLPAMYGYTEDPNGAPGSHQHYASGMSKTKVSDLKFPCQWCKEEGIDKGFGRDADLRRHVATLHTKEREYLCPLEYCERHTKPFTRKDHMQNHVKKHSETSDQSSTKRAAPAKKAKKGKNEEDRKMGEDDGDTGA